MQQNKELILLDIGDKAKVAFKKLKRKFLEGPLLVYYNPSLPSRVKTNALGFAILGILS
jgi:hypothetical protein